MASKIELSNANGKIVTIENNDSNMSDVTLNGASITKKVDTLADIRAMNELPETVWCSGYHTKNDGAFGSHIFRLKGVKTTETDNSGTIIIATIGGVDYVYELQFDGAVNVKWFGAVNGADSTIAFKALAASLLKGESIDLGGGRYTLFESIEFTTHSHIIFGDKNTRLIAGDNISGGMLNFTDIDGLKIRDIQFITTGYNAVALTFLSTFQYDNILIEDCSFNSGGYAPIYFGSLGFMISNFKVKGCDFIGDNSVVSAIDINFGTSNPDRETFKPLVVEGCTFEKYEHAMQTLGTGVIYNTVFKNNSVFNSNGRALHFYHNVDGVIESNIFDTYVDAVWVDGNTSIINNKFLSSTNDGLMVYNGSCTVSNNIVKNCGNDGIVVSVENTYGGLYNNQINNNNGNGIRVSAEPRGVSWTGSSRIYLVNINSNDIIDNGKNGILIDDTLINGTYGNSIDEVNIIGNLIGDNGTSDTTSQNIYSGIKIHYQHTTIIAGTKFHITGNNITYRLSQYMGTGNQYNAILMDTPTSGQPLTTFVDGNSLLANVSGYFFKDTKTYGNRFVTNNLYTGLISMAPFGNINTSGNMNTNKAFTTDTSFPGITIQYGSTSAPTTGTYSVGSIAYNKAVVAGGNIGWVCTVAGTPGTWKSFGTISA